MNFMDVAGSTCGKLLPTGKPIDVIDGMAAEHGQAAPLVAARLVAASALTRRESRGAHFRVEHQTSEGEALRNDEDYAYAAVWEYTGANSATDSNACAGSPSVS